MSQALTKPTVFLHWITAIVFMGVLGLGIYVEDMERSPEKFELLGTHKSLGIIVLAIALLRLVWRLKEGPISSVSDLSKLQAILAKGVHYLLLIATLSMPISGVVMSVGSGRAVSLFGLELIAEGAEVEWMSNLGHVIHGQSVNIILIALALHVLGALKHQYIDKDGTITRMMGK